MSIEIGQIYIINEYSYVKSVEMGLEPDRFLRIDSEEPFASEGREWFCSLSKDCFNWRQIDSPFIEEAIFTAAELMVFDSFLEKSNRLSRVL